MRKPLLFLAAMCLGHLVAHAQHIIRVSTDNTDLVMQVSPKGRLYQTYLGHRLASAADCAALPLIASAEAYAPSGTEDLSEPAVAVTHADGNMATYLYYESAEQRDVDGGTETVITLRDRAYPLTVRLHYVAYRRENVIKAWSEISHTEKKPVTLWRYASAMLHFREPSYYLTTYRSDWAQEGQPETERLTSGKKIVDSRLGTRAAMYAEPVFELGLGGLPREDEGRAVIGTIGWTGNFRLTFDVDYTGALRVIPAINPYASYYVLRAGEVFRTPEFVFAMSDCGTGQASRNMHDWARRYQIADGRGDRLTLLNNWESTGFDFDQKSLAQLMQDARDLGVDMFLLDDGWFANKYPRSNDRAGLGDWEPTRQKLPEGIPGMVRDAQKAGVKFGIWIEPEMVNPKSELFEKHPDWVIMQPNRDTYYYRNQLVLDISNPKVQDYVFGILDRIMTENPGVAYFKWDCNSMITNAWSPWHRQNQGNFYIDHVRGLYSVLQRVRQKYPNLPMMLCSGGGGRMDYEALKYFTEFWCSDNTDPYERLYIQWSLSKFFPAKAMASHVTNWNRRASLKFRTDVCSSCRLGFDIDLKSLSAEEMQFAREAVRNYNAMKPVIFEGDQYRLVSPYQTPHCAVQYVSKDRTRALLFAYNLHPRDTDRPLPVKMQGLDAARTYTVRETNLMPGAKSRLACDGRQYSGDYLMRVGLGVLGTAEGTSHVLVLE